MSRPKETPIPEQVGLKRLIEEMDNLKNETSKNNIRSVNLNQIDWRSAAVDPRTGVWTVDPEDGFPKGKLEYRIYFDGEWFVVLGWLDARVVDTEDDVAEKWVDKLNGYLELRAKAH